MAFVLYAIYKENILQVPDGYRRLLPQERFNGKRDLAPYGVDKICFGGIYNYWDDSYSARDNKTQEEAFVCRGPNWFSIKPAV